MAIDLEKEVKDLKRRVDLAETRLSQLEGQFGFISGQLRDIQLYMHTRFDDIDRKIDGVNGRIDGLRTELPLTSGASGHRLTIHSSTKVCIVTECAPYL